MMLMSFTVSIKAASYAIPADLPTIEQLQELHKLFSKAEEEAKNKVETSSGIQGFITDNTNKFKEARDVWDSKLQMANQWVSLASILGNISLETVDLTKDYAEYTKLMAKNIVKKPIIDFYYAQTNYEIVQFIKLAQKQLATLFLSTGDVLKASMEERLTMALSIEGVINHVHDMISQSLWWCQAVDSRIIKVDYFWEIINSDFLHDLSQQAISDWKKECEEGV